MMRLSFPSFLSIVFLFLLLPRSLFCCGPFLHEFSGYEFFDISQIKSPALETQLFLNYEHLRSSFLQQEKIQEKTNLEEWESIFCMAIPQKDIQEIIYGEADLINAIQSAAASSNKKLSLRLSKNAFATHLVNQNCLETIEYLAFAKKVEPHVVGPKHMWEEYKKDVVAMNQLIYEGERIFSKLKSNTLKLRYAYQLIRLAHYAGSYEKALELYEILLPKVDGVNSILYNWILAHKAGVLYAKGERAEAAYLFSLVYDKSPSKREPAFRSFSIQNEQEWQDALLLCQSDHERATLYALRASHKDSKPINDMKAIYALEPDNPHLPILLAKEIKNLEEDFAGYQFNPEKEYNKKDFNIPRAYAKQNLAALSEFLAQVVQEDKVQNIDLWTLSQGYLYFLANNHYDADKIFASLEDKLQDPKQKEQLAIYRLLLSIDKIETIDDEIEEGVWDIMRDNPLYKRHFYLQKYLKDKMAYEYNEQNEPGKAFKIRHNLELLKPHPQKEILDNLIEVASQIEKNSLEKRLTSAPNGAPELNEYFKLKGLYYWDNDQPEAALETFKRVPLSQRKREMFNPFVELEKDCVHCDIPDSLKLYTRAGILSKMFELEFKAKSDYLNSASYYYRLGLAEYNMSFFGHSWKVKDLFRSANGWHYRKHNLFQHWDYPYGNKEMVDLSKARFYFEKILEIGAERELEARAAFWLAKIDYLTFATSQFNKRSYYSDKILDLPEAYLKYYKLLYTDYQETNFYKDMIEECSYFEKYVP